MNEQQVEETELRRYLLGELTLEERVLIEERMFLDSAYMQLARALKDELVDDYVNHDLTPAEREKFESHFLAQPAHRDDLRIAQTLNRFLVSETVSANAVLAPRAGVSPADHGGAPPFRERVRSFLASLFGRKTILALSFAAALIILSAIIWLAVGSWRRRERTPLRAQDPTPQQNAPGRQQRSPESAGAPPDNSRSPGVGREVAGGQKGGQGSAAPGGKREDGRAGRQGGRTQGAPPPSAQAPRGVATYVLMPGGGVRGGGPDESVSVTIHMMTVVLRLPLVEEGDYRRYSATLETGGRVAYTFDKLKPEVDPELGRVVRLIVPADHLRQQSYQVKLSGVTADGQTRSLPSYTFTVERR